ncbi:remorin 4.2-like isoform X2 [Abrus precatorius]|uniref:Remorin 4.2-like isoform X2 n=1 Tax=Abrus precatorius TaxID=3816 RepID=A0A8B8MDP5_ABRPR|nr:remorin 4.2-like isoform X2 [Abrus precatorius]
MSNDRRPSTSHATQDTDADHDHDHDHEQHIREIHALTPPPHRREPPIWETQTQPNSLSQHSSSVSIANTEAASTENFTSMSREFSALVLAGSSIDHNNTNTTSPLNMMMNEGGVDSNNNNNNLGRIGEDELLMIEETNPLAIVPDSNPLEPVSSSPRRGGGEVTVQRVRKEEVEAKIGAWQNAKVAKINNRFKREDAVINGWENEQVHKATSWMKKVERKLEEKRAKALEKMQNEVAKAHRKAEERRASAEAKRGTKVARVLEIANLMRAVGRAPTKRSFF